MNIVKDLRQKLNSLMLDVKKDNPNANWKNLVTGLLILVLVGLFSVWYFSNASTEAPLFENLIESTDNNEVDAQTDDESGEDVKNVVAAEGMVVVGDTEGLWQVAERVCGDGEKYTYLAEANGMSIWFAPVVPGQQLVLDCGPTK